MAKDLSQRVNSRANRSGGEVATQQDSLNKKINNMVPAFERALRDHALADQLARDALTSIHQNPDLAACTEVSILGGLMNIAQLGLRCGGPLGHSWLIPLRNWKTGEMEATLILGYKGLAELAYRCGDLRKIAAHTVHQNDDFRVAFGLNEELHHIPVFSDPGDPIAYYSVAWYKPDPGQEQGEAKFDVMGHEEMIAFRDKYAMSQNKKTGVLNSNSPWLTAPEQMALKTVFKRLTKLMRLSNAPDLAQGLAADETVRVDSTVERTALDPGTGVVVSPEDHEAPEGRQEATEAEPLTDEEAPPEE